MKLNQIVCSLFVMSVLVAFVPLASAQTTCDLIPGPCAERAARAAYAPVDRVLGQTNYGGYYPGVGIGGGGRVATIIGLAVAGASIGYGIGGGRGAAIGGGAGVVGGILATRTRNVDVYGQRSAKEVDCSKKKLSKKEQSICQQAFAEQQAQAAEEQNRAEVAERQRTGKRLQNKTGFPVEICDCGQIVGMLRNGQTMPALEARCGYSAQMLVPDPTQPGITVRRDAEFHVAPDMSGWVFIAPRIYQGGGR